MELRIGNKNEYVLFTLPHPLYREITEAPYEWNLVAATVSAGAWTSQKILINLTAEEIVKFLKALVLIFKDLKGSARLESLEEWITLTVEMTSNGESQYQW
jgi:hypothetical protein